MIVRGMPCPLTNRRTADKNSTLDIRRYMPWVAAFGADIDNFYRPFFKLASAKSRNAFQSEALMMCAPV